MKKRITRSIVPNLLTLGNLFCGFTSIVFISDGDFTKAALFILLAAIFDMLDGVAARLIKSASEFGVELDSLCDAVSFGVAPAYMLHQTHFYKYGEIGILIAALPALAGAVRLARFNIKITSFEDKLYFHGLPIPSSALTIVSYLIYIHIPKIIPDEYLFYLAPFVVITTSLAMVSNIKFDNLPRPTLRSIKQRPVIFGLFIAGLIASIITKGKFIFPFMIFYIIGSAIRSLVFWIKEVKEPEDEIDETEEAEPSGFDI
jgi:CDP-diacylglycerol--serine O-phosphatidyltransferase